MKLLQSLIGIWQNAPGLKRIIPNSAWMLADRVVKLIVGLFIIAALARHLGPESFGVLYYAVAIVALFQAFGTLGLQNVAVHDIIQNPHQVGEIIGTTFWLQALGGFLAMGLAAAMVLILQGTDELLIAMVLVLATGQLFSCGQAFKYFFIAKMRNRGPVLVETSAFLLSSTIKIVLIFIDASLTAFAIAIALEYAFAGLGFFRLYYRNSIGEQSPRFSRIRAQTLLQQSWPLALAGLAVMTYMRIDQVMIGKILHKEDLGLYSVAVRLSELWYFIPMAVITTTYPLLLEIKIRSLSLYEYRLKQLYLALVGLSVLVALVITLFGAQFLMAFFGPSYVGAKTALAIHTWAGPFVVFGLISGRWMIAEGLNRYNLLRSLIGAGINIALNFLLIAPFGIAGAAFATLISYAISALFIDLLIPALRPSFRLKRESILFKFN